MRTTNLKYTAPKETPETPVNVAFTALSKAIKAHGNTQCKKALEAFLGPFSDYTRKARFWRTYADLINKAGAYVAEQMSKEMSKDFLTEPQTEKEN